MTGKPMKIGDTVRLKSGGTTMSVDAFGKGDRVVCVWFEHRGDKVHRASFAKAALVVE